MTRRAYESALLDVHFTNPRDFALGNYQRVDDRPFGGGPGMVMMAEPLTSSLQHIRAQRNDHVPSGAVFSVGQDPESRDGAALVGE